MLFCHRIRPSWRRNWSGSTFSCNESGVWFLLFLRDSTALRNPISWVDAELAGHDWASALLLNFMVCCLNRRLAHLQGGKCDTILPRAESGKQRSINLKEIVCGLRWWTLVGESNWKVPQVLSLPVTHTSFYREAAARIIKWLCLCSLLLWEKYYLLCKVRNRAHFPSCLNTCAYSEQYLWVYSSGHFKWTCLGFIGSSTPPPSVTLRS